MADVRGELSVQQAADMLNVSREYVVRLLDEGVIASSVVDGERLVAREDLREYQRRDDAVRRAAADELGELGRELGA
ncbi:helix-turn-helix domain-containing protein [Nonomuraea sp. NPDC051191]|uniref:helix-turn-helix domain-containing protein n=1 Tax=Nonomuraea sp. NPDC051191 TaxID=3364372 RepID=UPI0037AC88DF